MGIFDQNLTARKKIKNNLSLDEILRVSDILELWSEDLSDQDDLSDAIYHAIKANELKFEKNERIVNRITYENYKIVVYWEPGSNNDWLGPFEIRIHKNDFKNWLDNNNQLPPNESLVNDWLINQQIKTKTNNTTNEITTLSPINQKRIANIKIFITHLEALSKQNNFEFDSLDMQCNVHMLLDALKRWEKQRGVAIKDRLWTTLKAGIDKKFWQSIERKEICNVCSAKEFPEKNYFKKFNL